MSFANSSREITPSLFTSRRPNWSLEGSDTSLQWVQVVPRRRNLPARLMKLNANTPRTCSNSLVLLRRRPSLWALLPGRPSMCTGAGSWACRWVQPTSGRGKRTEAAPQKPAQAVPHTGRRLGCRTRAGESRPVQRSGTVPPLPPRTTWVVRLGVRPGGPRSRWPVLHYIGACPCRWGHTWPAFP